MRKHTSSHSRHVANKPSDSIRRKSLGSIAEMAHADTEDPRLEGITAEIEPELQHHMVEIAAYYRAEQRGFQNGNAMDDWLAAEAEIGALLST